MKEPTLAEQFEFHLAVESAVEKFEYQLVLMGINSALNLVMGPEYVQKTAENPPEWFTDWAERTGAAIESKQMSKLNEQLQEFILRSLGKWVNTNETSTNVC